jgi:Trypsin-like peptidase domain/von Willebrand factor type A domain
MSHSCGRVVSVGTRIGPDSGAPQSGPGFWELLFTPSPAPSGDPPRFVLLHFVNLAFPAGERVEVELGYGTDTFAASSGSDAWTRPIDPQLGPIRIRYFGAGPAGGATLAEYGSGEPTQTGTPGDLLGSLTNVDVFLQTDPYVEPIYETRLKCGVFDWENAACASAGSIEQQVAPAVCGFVNVHRHPRFEVTTCSGTLIDSNLVLTAAHCAKDPDELEARSGSVIFGYETTCSGSRPSGYAPRVFKVTDIFRPGTADWVILEIATPAGGAGITPAQLRSSGPVARETVIAIHHPHGAVKKIQTGALAADTVAPVVGFDFAGGSSGSALFDAAGQIVGGALSAGPIGDACRASYVPATTILQELANPPAPPAPVDVELVVDRSGSMLAPGTSPGRTKMQEARDAASLFAQLVRQNAGHRIGLVSFSTTAGRPPDSALGAVDAAKKPELVGPSPYTSGRLGALAASGATSIGDGLAVAIDALSPAGANQRAVLLMTDGLQNTPPMIESVEGALGSIRLVAIGFGAESDLDSALLSRVARDHDGLYTRANDGLELKKFFALAFGDIFESGALSDPALVLDQHETATPAHPFAVCEEDQVTAIVGWDDPSQYLALELDTPGGATVAAGTAGVDADAGETWQFLRVALPLAGERAGTWQWRVRRTGGGELTPPPATVRLFVTVIPRGGPRFEAVAQSGRIYTGDPVVPLVALRYQGGGAPYADVTVDIEAPDTAVGQLVADAGLTTPTLGDDAVDAFHATLAQLGGGSAFSIATRQETAQLFDDGEHRDGALERDGIYGNELTGLTRFEGTYRFHARASIAEPCPAQRETRWAIHVDLGIDPERTTVTVTGATTGPRGERQGTVVITPKDRYGSPLGPGRPEVVPASGGPGTTTVGAVVDNGDGSYSVPVSWDPAVVDGPSVVISQPDRPPVVIAPSDGTTAMRCPPWLWALLIALALLLLIALVIVILLAV